MKQQRIEPGPGQESVWDYPRPPKVEPCTALIEILCDGITIAQTQASCRVLETSHPPVYYLPPESIRMDLLQEASHGSFCEWKGHAHYFSLILPDRTIPNVAWTYKTPTARFESIAGYLAFYPSKVDACFVDGERVQSQSGDFYGGWITSNIVGPFKGGAGTWGW
jgi:uncharacterized protein (DUF427 family)